MKFCRKELKSRLLYKINNMKTIEFKSKNFINSDSSENKKPKIWVSLLVGLIIGFINGFWGGGGGMLCVPALTYILKMKDKMAHATTILIMLPLSIASLVVYLIKGTIEWGIAINISIGFAIGGLLGALILNKINNVVLQFVFAIVIIIGGVKLII